MAAAWAASILKLVATIIIPGWHPLGWAALGRQPGWRRETLAYLCTAHLGMKAQAAEEEKPANIEGGVKSGGRRGLRDERRYLSMKTWHVSEEKAGGG